MENLKNDIFELNSLKKYVKQITHKKGKFSLDINKNELNILIYNFSYYLAFFKMRNIISQELYNNILLVFENLKNNKLEKWNKGMQKGLTQYVKENYDEEREALDKQALKERKLQQNNNVTAMNKEIYDLDLEEQMHNDAAIDAEEYSMSNIPDDDDFNYDNGDDDYANGNHEDYD
jgi:hypothetical protein